MPIHKIYTVFELGSLTLLHNKLLCASFDVLIESIFEEIRFHFRNLWFRHTIVFLLVRIPNS